MDVFRALFSGLHMEHVANVTLSRKVIPRMPALLNTKSILIAYVNKYESARISCRIISMNNFHK